MFEKIIRDPVHDVIAFRLEKPVDALLFGLINAAEFQRLRRIRQLGLANLAYPGADHSRYSHSLGVMQTARRMMDQLAHSFAIDEQQAIACLAAALLHDLGHGPLSHVFERVSGIEHEKLTHRIVLDPESEVHQLLAEHDGQLPERVVAMLRGEPNRSFYCDVISSQLDADRLDYLLRDNLMTGSQYGDYDLTWLLHALTIDEASDRLAVTWKGVSAVEAYLQSRYHMYRNVYFHKTVRSAEGMVKLALQRARRLAVQDRLPWPGREHGVFKALMGQRLTIEEFTDLDDVSMQHCLKIWMRAEDAVLAGLCRGLMYRKLYKTIDLTRHDEADARTALEGAQRAVEKAGGDPAYDLFYDEALDAVEDRDFQKQTGSGEIAVKDPDGACRAFSEVSPLTTALNQQLLFRRIHVSEAYRDAVGKALLC